MLNTIKTFFGKYKKILGVVVAVIAIVYAAWRYFKK